MMKTTRVPWALLVTSLLLARHAAVRAASAEADALANSAKGLGGGTSFAATQADACANKDKVTYSSPSAYKAEYGELHIVPLPGHVGTFDLQGCQAPAPMESFNACH